MVLRVGGMLAMLTLTACIGTPGAGGASDGERVAAGVEAIVGGEVDVVLTPSGSYSLRDPDNWARDASVGVVQCVPAGCVGASCTCSIVCSGTLVSPRVVITNAHCVNTVDMRLEVSFGPRTQVSDPDLLPLNTPASVRVPVAGCFTHPGSSITCNGGESEADLDRDLAVLVLDRRIDPGLTGHRATAYPALHATIVASDPPIGPEGWSDADVLHVGYSSPQLRNVAHQQVQDGEYNVLGITGVVLFYGFHGVFGDSGGGYFLDGDAGPRRRLLAVHHRSFSPGGDVGMRLTWNGSEPIQGWLTAFLGAHPSFSGTQLGLPGGVTVWTGGTQVPPRSEPDARREIEGVEALDPDGDGLVGEYDNCWGISNIEQNLSDTQPRDCTTPGGEGRTWSCDAATSNAPGAVEVNTIDSDHDGIPLGCDNCPAVSNPGQADCDEDGVGDACLCGLPGVPAGACELNTDPDPRPDECDNCLGVANADQRNCNLDAETVLDQPHFGDACDPTPCAGGAIVNYPSGDPGWGTPTFEVDPTGATPGEFATGFRFCPCTVADSSPESALICRNDVDDVGSGRCPLAVSGLYDELPLPLEHARWRVPTLFGPERLFGTEITRTHDLAFEITYRGRWAVSEDRERWLSRFPSQYPSDASEEPGQQPLPVGAPVRGVGWYSTRDVRPEHRSLANHYVGALVVPNPPATGEVPPWAMEEPLIPVLPLPLENEICPYCFDWLPIPWLMLPCLDDGCIDVDPEAPLVGWREELITEPSFAPAGLAALAGHDLEGVRWAAAPESPRMASAASLRLVAFDAAGREPTRLLAITSSGIRPFQGGPNDPRPGPVVVRSPNAELRPPERTGYSLAVSATHSSTWLVGGVSADGSQSPDVWRYAAIPGEWFPLQLSGVAIGRVLSIAYSPAEDALFLLDVVEHGRRENVRLLRVAPHGGAVVIEGSWPRVRTAALTALVATDVEGNVWLAGSLGSSHRHAVVRLRRDRHGQLQPAGFRNGDGALQIGGAFASSAGLSLAVRRRSGLPRVVGYRARDLVPRGGPGDCF